MAMIPRPGTGRTLVPKVGNPNVLSVYQPMDFSDAIGAGVTPSYAPPSTTAYGAAPPAPPGLSGMDEDDAFFPPDVPSAAQGGANYGKRVFSDNQGETTTAKAAASTGKDEGLFLPDAVAGTPLDPFNMDALRRYTERHLALMHEPVVKFAASVAQKIGKNPDSMLLNGGVLLDPKAPSVQAMFATSALSKVSAGNALAQAIARAVVELMQVEKDKTAAMVAVKRQKQEAQPQPPPQPEKDNGALQEVKLEADISHIGTALNMVYEHIGVRNIFQPAVRRAGQPGDGGGQGEAAADPQAEFPATSILRQLATFLSRLDEERSTARWVWNSLPENSGIAIIRGDVVEAMEDCHAEIREHIPDVQMWHLITGPHVRGKFATMVAEYINEGPGELQFPNYQSTRGPNVLTGSRISAGKFREVRAVQRVRKAKAWFANVSYGPSEAWTYVQEQAPIARVRIVQAREDVVKWLEACQQDVAALWQALLTQRIPGIDPDQDEYSEILTEHYDTRGLLARAEKQKSEADADVVRGVEDGVSENEQSEREHAARAEARRVATERQNLAEAVTSLNRFATGGLRRRLGMSAEYVNALNTALRKKDEEGIIHNSDALFVALTEALNRVSLYPDSEADSTMLLKVLTAVTAMRQSIGAVKEAQRVLVKVERDLITFPEADKRELFHHAPAPIDRSWLVPYGANPMVSSYASW